MLPSPAVCVCVCARACVCVLSNTPLLAYIGVGLYSFCRLDVFGQANKAYVHRYINMVFPF